MGKIGKKYQTKDFMVKEVPPEGVVQYMNYVNYLHYFYYLAYLCYLHYLQYLQYLPILKVNSTAKYEH